MRYPGRSAAAPDGITIDGRGIRAAAIFLEPQSFGKRARHLVGWFGAACAVRFCGRRGSTSAWWRAYTPSDLLFEGNTPQQPFMETP